MSLSKADADKIKIIVTNFKSKSPARRKELLDKYLGQIDSNSESPEKTKTNRIIYGYLVTANDERIKEEKEEKEEKEKKMLDNLSESVVDQIDLQEEEKDNGPDAIDAIEEKDIQTVIQILIQTQLPDYAEGKTNEYYRNEYLIKHRDEIEIEEHKEDDPSGGKTQKKKKKKKKKTKGVLRQRTIKRTKCDINMLQYGSDGKDNEKKG